MTQPVNSAALAAPVNAAEPAAAPAKAQWIKSIDLNYNATSNVFHAADSIENTFLYGVSKVACAAGAAFTAILETLTNAVFALVNGGIWAANGAHSFFETTEEPEAPVPAPVVPPKEEPVVPIVEAPVPVVEAPVVVAPVVETPVVETPKKVVVAPQPRTTKEIAGDLTNSAVAFAKTHKAAVISAPVGGTAAGLAVAYFTSLGALASSATGVGSAFALGYVANKAANYIANRQAAKAAPVAVATPVAVAAPVAVRV